MLTGIDTVDGVIYFIGIASFIINIGGVLMSELTFVSELTITGFEEPAFSSRLSAFITTLLV